MIMLIIRIRMNNDTNKEIDDNDDDDNSKAGAPKAKGARDGDARLGAHKREAPNVLGRDEAMFGDVLFV